MVETLRTALSVAIVVVFIALVSISIGTVPEGAAPLSPLAVSPTTTPYTSPFLLATSTVATTTKPAPKPATPKSVVPKPTKPITVPTPQPKDITLSLNEAIQSITDLASGQSTTTLSINDRVRAALVNIICTTEVSGAFESISGSGVMIDPRGVILTNAHVAQFFLLKDYPHKNFVQCIVRTGSPARPMYTAELLFIPPKWINDNASKIIQENPTGTGERDYALLRITGTVGPSILRPALLPFVLVSVIEPKIGQDVLQAGYAAGFLGGITVQNDLFASSAYTTVRGQPLTYGTNTFDLMSLGGTIVAQHGSSGGAVTNTDGTLIGIIVTSTNAADTAARDLRALTTAYIVRDFESERGKSMGSLLSSDDLAAEAAVFEKIFAPSERQTLITVIESQ